MHPTERPDDRLGPLLPFNIGDDRRDAAWIAAIREACGGDVYVTITWEASPPVPGAQPAPWRDGVRLADPGPAQGRWRDLASFITRRTIFPTSGAVPRGQSMVSAPVRLAQGAADSGG